MIDSCEKMKGQRLVFYFRRNTVTWPKLLSCQKFHQSGRPWWENLYPGSMCSSYKTIQGRQLLAHQVYSAYFHLDHPYKGLLLCFGDIKTFVFALDYEGKKEEDITLREDNKDILFSWSIERTLFWIICINQNSRENGHIIYYKLKRTLRK